MLINKNNINDLEAWVDITEIVDGVVRTLGTTTSTPEQENLDSINAYGRRRLHSINYTHREISVELLVSGPSRVDVNNRIERVSQMFTGEFALILSNEPDRIYREVSLSKAIDKEVISANAVLLTIPLIAYNPFKYGDPKEHKYLGVTGNTIVYLENTGSFTTKPTYTIEGKASEVNIKVGGRTTTYINLQEGEVIEFNSDRLTVIRKANGTQESALANWRDNFIELEPGVNQVEISGNIESIDIIIGYRNTYL